MTHTNLHTEEERIIADLETAFLGVMRNDDGWTAEIAELQTWLRRSFSSYRQVMKGELEGILKKGCCEKCGQGTRPPYCINPICLCHQLNN